MKMTRAFRGTIAGAVICLVGGVSIAYAAYSDSDWSGKAGDGIGMLFYGIGFLIVCLGVVVMLVSLLCGGVESIGLMLRRRRGMDDVAQRGEPRR